MVFGDIIYEVAEISIEDDILVEYSFIKKDLTGENIQISGTCKGILKDLNTCGVVWKLPITEIFLEEFKNPLLYIVFVKESGDGFAYVEDFL